MQSKETFERDLLLEQLADASERVDEVQEIIDRQRTRIRMLRQYGKEIAGAEMVLAQLEQSQTTFIAERDGLEALLA